jgi:hypothetical protein
MKMTVKPKVEHAKPGDLLSTHIEYGAGGSASVHHVHEPQPGKKSEPWSPGPSPLKHNFSSRAEALHHAAEHAGVSASLEDENPEPSDIGEEENEEAGAGVDTGPIKREGKRRMVQPSGLGT